jgi:hypothetical protein
LKKKLLMFINHYRAHVSSHFSNRNSEMFVALPRPTARRVRFDAQGNRLPRVPSASSRLEMARFAKLVCQLPSIMDTRPDLFLDGVVGPAVTSAPSRVNEVECNNPAELGAASQHTGDSKITEGSVVAAKWRDDGNYYPAIVLRRLGCYSFDVRFLADGIQQVVSKRNIHLDPRFGMCARDKQVWSTGRVKTFDNKQYRF